LNIVFGSDGKAEFLSSHYYSSLQWHMIL